LLFAGCGPGPTEPSTGPASPDSPGPVGSGRPRIALVMKSLANEFFFTMENGARAHQKSHATDYDLIANGIKTGFGDDWIRFGATFEHMVDGSFSERTMAMSVPFPGRIPPYYGNVAQSQEALDAWVEKVHRAGIQANCHANGDVAIGMALSAYERAQKLYPVADPRFKITHCTLVNDDLVRRIKAVGAIPAPFTSYAYYNSDKFGFYGEDLMRNAMAFRSFLDAGIQVCAGSDFYPGPFAPMVVSNPAMRGPIACEMSSACSSLPSSCSARINPLRMSSVRCARRSSMRTWK